LHKLKQQGKRYPWERPPRCPSCRGKRLWGHGYVLRFFDGIDEGVWLKRYRCPECRAVHTIRPDTHYRGFWACWLTILCSLLGTITHNSCWKNISRQRKKYWWDGFIKQASRQGNFPENPLQALEELLSQNIIISTHSLKYCEKKPYGVLPYPMFSVTPHTGYG